MKKKGALAAALAITILLSVSGAAAAGSKKSVSTELTPEAALEELQRRFAPRITRRARELLETLTGGRYDRLSWGEDFSLTAGALGEDTQRGVLWRSDGTADQLYLALRLAVAEELTPEAPLILDDALVRFDDTRLEAALRLLRKEAERRQVILFTCQSREKEILARMRRE